MGEGRRTGFAVACRGLLVGLLPCLLLWVAAPAARAGDPEVAQFLLKKAEKELRARDYGAAANDFRRAREEHTPLPEAAFGLGQALEELGRESDALAAYRECVAEVGAMEKPGFKERGAARRSATAIRRLRRRYEALDKATRAFIDDLLATAFLHGGWPVPLLACRNNRAKAQRRWQCKVGSGRGRKDSTVRIRAPLH